jgi:hypothetical protein
MIKNNDDKICLPQSHYQAQFWKLWYSIPQRISYDIELKTHIKHILKSGFFPVCFLSAERQALGPLVI